jgi:hypothetical protein
MAFYNTYNWKVGLLLERTAFMTRMKILTFSVKEY